MSVVYYKLTGPVPGTLLDGTMWVSHNAETNAYLAHAPIPAAMFHAALAAGAISLTSGATVPGPRPESPDGFRGLRLVREA